MAEPADRSVASDVVVVAAVEVTLGPSREYRVVGARSPGGRGVRPTCRAAHTAPAALGSGSSACAWNDSSLPLRTRANVATPMATMVPSLRTVNSSRLRTDGPMNRDVAGVGSVLGSYMRPASALRETMAATAGAMVLSGSATTSRSSAPYWPLTRRSSPTIISGWVGEVLVDEHLTVDGGAPGAATATTRRRAADPGLRLRRNTTSVTTSVPAAARKVPAGSRMAPSRSARSAISRRAASLRASRVKRLVTTATNPPGRVRSRPLMMKWLWIELPAGVVDRVVQRDLAERDVADHQVHLTVGAEWCRRSSRPRCWPPG